MESVILADVEAQPTLRATLAPALHFVASELPQTTVSAGDQEERFTPPLYQAIEARLATTCG